MVVLHLFRETVILSLLQQEIFVLRAHVITFKLFASEGFVKQFTLTFSLLTQDFIKLSFVKQKAR